MVKSVDRAVAARASLKKSKIPHERTSLQSQIAATDRQIDALVYELYGLTDAEIRIVEGETDDYAGNPPPSDGGHQRNGKSDVGVSHEDEELSPDIAAAIAQMKNLDETKLRHAVEDVLSTKDVRRLEALNRKAQNEGLSAAEQKERDELSHNYEKALVVRATALAELHKRGVDVADLIAP